MKAEERDMLCKIILSMIKKGHEHWTDLKKRVLRSGHWFATDSTFASQMHYLLRKGYIERVSRGIYHVTEKGETYREIV